MNRKPYAYLAAVAMAIAPAIAFASSKTLSDLVITVTGYLNQALVLMMSLAVVIFVWQIIQYYIKPDAERAEAGKYVMYSVIGFFIILSFWGIVNVLQNTFGLDNESNQPSSWASFTSLFPSQ